MVNETIIYLNNTCYIRKLSESCNLNCQYYIHICRTAFVYSLLIINSFIKNLIYFSTTAIITCKRSIKFAGDYIPSEEPCYDLKFNQQIAQHESLHNLTLSLKTVLHYIIHGTIEQ